MRLSVLLVPICTLPLLAGCIIEVDESDEPVSPAPFPDDEPTEHPGIAPGEPNPNAPREGFQELYRADWCYYEETPFEGRVFPDQSAFNKTWEKYLECHPTGDPVAFPKVDWERTFVAALIARPSGCAGALLNVTHASAHEGRYLVQYDYDSNEGSPCAAAMSRPLAFIGIDRVYGDRLLVDFVEVEQS